MEGTKEAETTAGEIVRCPVCLIVVLFAAGLRANNEARDKTWARKGRSRWAKSDHTQHAHAHAFLKNWVVQTFRGYTRNQRQYLVGRVVKAARNRTQIRQAPCSIARNRLTQHKLVLQDVKYLMAAGTPPIKGPTQITPSNRQRGTENLYAHIPCSQ